MTLEEFRAKFKSLGVKLEADATGRLRTIDQRLCPVCYLCWAETGQRFANDQVVEAAELLGLDEFARKQIAWTADNLITLSAFNREVRTELETML